MSKFVSFLYLVIIPNIFQNDRYILYIWNIGKYSTIKVKEELEELKTLRNREKNHRLKTRIQSLILTKENKFKTREELANHLGVGVSSLYWWTEVYKKSGIDAMLKISNVGVRGFLVK